MSNSEKPLHIDMPVSLPEVKMAFSIAAKTLRGADVKTFRLFKLPFLLCALLGSLLLSPACRAQSEIAPDFFDCPNTVAFEKVRAPVPSEAHKLQKTVAPAARRTQGKTGQSVELTASTATPQGAVATDKKRKAVARKPKQ